jgi:purine-binding chemotaxis protein CheW
MTRRTEPAGRRVRSERRTRGETAARGLSAREVLLSRARKYAQSPVVEDADPGAECLGFVRSGERYLIETRYVVEVANRDLTRVPGAPPALLGLVNLRGEIVPVFDLARVLGRTENAPPPDAAPLIVLGSARAEAAICVESLEGTSRLKQDELVDSRPDHALVRGATRDARLLLDGRALLDGPALSLDAAGSTATGSEVSS